MTKLHPEEAVERVAAAKAAKAAKAKQAGGNSVLTAKHEQAHVDASQQAELPSDSSSDSGPHTQEYLMRETGRLLGDLNRELDMDNLAMTLDEIDHIPDPQKPSSENAN